ncbi:MAG: hypothetical protein GC154_10160 [bacterium]|nr:hypothetical protein [bacterium]
MGIIDAGEGREFYFAYCLNMDPKRLNRCGVAAISYQYAVLPDYRLTFNVLEDEHFSFERRGLANIAPAPGEVVEGVLYAIPEEQVFLLDRRASVRELKYYRKRVLVHDSNGHGVEAFAYAAWPDKTANNLRPGEKYLSFLQAAAERQGCSKRFLDWLAKQPTIA